MVFDMDLFTDSEISFLKGQRVARIATISIKNGIPHVVPICFTFDKSFFYTSLHRNSIRLRNLDYRSCIALEFDKYEEQEGEWITLQGILMFGNVTLLSFLENQEEFLQGWRLLIEKYPQYRQWAFDDMTPSDPNVRRIMQIQPIKKCSWGF